MCGGSREREREGEREGERERGRCFHMYKKETPAFLALPPPPVSVHGLKRGG
jgi:hypothetical protein